MHSHLPVQHVLKQVELYKAKRRKRDVRPQWVTDFINEAAELFEPLTGVGRVGFDCQLAEDRWMIGLYLGSTELVGGKEDGRSRVTDFEFDLLRLVGKFSTVERFRWNAYPSRCDETGSPADSLVLIEGRLQEQPLRLEVYSVPPTYVGPGFRQFSDGRQETV